MRRASAIAFTGIAGAALLGGCADLMQQSAGAGFAPEWFEAKAVELKGEGYPKLIDIPETRPIQMSEAGVDSMSTKLKDDAAKVDAKLAADGALVTDEDMRARAAQWRATVEEGAAKADAEAAKGDKPKVDSRIQP